jgi:hypothetical protein
MRYETIIYRDGEAGGIIMHRDEPFSSVKAIARAQVESGSASRTETRDESGKLVDHFPRVLRPS